MGFRGRPAFEKFWFIVVTPDLQSKEGSTKEPGAIVVFPSFGGHPVGTMEK